MRKSAIRIAIALCTLGVALCGLGAARQGGGAPRRIEITAKRFSYTPNAITIRLSEPVILVFHSEDVTHGIEISGLGIKKDLPKGKDVAIPITPAQTGDFYGACSHFCGVDHASMIFEINVVN